MHGHNLGTRDVANVPVRIEGKAGRKVVDIIPLVKGDGLAWRLFRGLGVVPQGDADADRQSRRRQGAYAEANRDNNVVIFTLP